MDRKTARKYTEDHIASPVSAKAPRAYTTRVTDFDKFWPEIQSMLELENDLKPYIILEHMLEKHKDAFDPKWKRTLERRISKWRISNGIEKDVSFSQIHKPGDVLAIDFTDLSSLGIRIASELLESNHLVFHATLTYSVPNGGIAGTHVFVVFRPDTADKSGPSGFTVGRGLDRHSKRR